ncbi:hypothetical protein CLV90_0981 [Maribacter spongiicola]|uniref:Uncharacterized protein n=1 Tax=Maribacter spongiicola TaxID=1206753 RepID=A0A4R7K6L6_9FLAO|nr:hypothetical protein [Maribacter spongiicola]TDT46917.1 hypothetical protein CLV90_0981 [Maribacter spongiicola]
MDSNSKIKLIKNELPKMGLVDRFFYLVNELYLEYFRKLDIVNPIMEWESFELDDKWEEIELDTITIRELAIWYGFLQDYGDEEIKSFILSEIKLLIPIFKQRFAFEISYLYTKNHSKDYYLSGNPEFLVLSPFFYDQSSLESAYIHELAISEVEDRKYLIKKYEAAIAEIKYRLKSDYVWDASLEDNRATIVDEIVFPERSVINLNHLTSFLKELAETPLNKISYTFNENKEEEKLVLIGLHPEVLVKLFSQILKRDKTILIRNFVAHSFNFNFKKYSFQKDITKEVLALKSKEDTIVICKTILLLTSLNYIQPEGASFIKRVLIKALKKQKKNTRVWLSDDLRKYISEWMSMSPNDLAKAIGYSSKEEFLNSLL